MFALPTSAEHAANHACDRELAARAHRRSADHNVRAYNDEGWVRRPGQGAERSAAMEARRTRGTALDSLLQRMYAREETAPRAMPQGPNINFVRDAILR